MIHAMQLGATACATIVIAAIIADLCSSGSCQASPDGRDKAIEISIRHWSGLEKIRSNKEQYPDALKRIIDSSDFQDMDSPNRYAELASYQSGGRWSVDYWQILPNGTAHVITDIDGCGHIGEFTTFLVDETRK